MTYKKKSKQKYAQRQKLVSKVKAKIKKSKATPKVATKKKVDVPLKLGPGKKATLTFKLKGLNIAVPVRWETMKTIPLVKTIMRDAQGNEVKMKYLGPKKRKAYINSFQKEVDKSEVKIMQILDDGSEKAMKAFEQTKNLTPKKTYDKKVMDEFLPSSFIVVWGEDGGANNGLRDVAWHLKKDNEVAVIKAFSKSKGTKTYYAFLYPVVKGDKFAMEAMLSENKRKHHRWMAVEPEDTEAVGVAEIPDLL